MWNAHPTAPVISDEVQKLSLKTMTTPVVFKGGKVSKNPFGLASLTNAQSNDDGTLHENELNWLKRRSLGGFGIMNTCCVHVQENGLGWAGEWGNFNDTHTAGYKQFADMCHEDNNLAIVQLFHAGIRGDSLVHGLINTSCVDTVYKSRSGDRPAKGLDEEGIQRLIADFAAAAKRCEDAGCDGIEIHCAHGYILCQFLCPKLNTRTDKWGGPLLENRARLILEVMRACKKATSPGFIIGARFSPEVGPEQAGWVMDPDENLLVAQWLAAEGIQYISVSILGHSPTFVSVKNRGQEGAKPLITIFREGLPEDVVVMCCGGITRAEDVQQLLNMNIDVAVLGCTAISTPEFPQLCQANDKFVVSTYPPYNKDFLVTVDVSPMFVGILNGMGLLEQPKVVDQ